MGRKQAEENYQEDCRRADQTINDLCAEYKAYMEEFRQYDQYVNEIYSEFDGI
jgi:hypothetical protein